MLVSPGYRTVVRTLSGWHSRLSVMLFLRCRDTECLHLFAGVLSSNRAATWGGKNPHPMSKGESHLLSAFIHLQVATKMASSRQPPSSTAKELPMRWLPNNTNHSCQLGRSSRRYLTY